MTSPSLYINSDGDAPGRALPARSAAAPSPKAPAAPLRVAGAGNRPASEHRDERAWSGVAAKQGCGGRPKTDLFHLFTHDALVPRAETIPTSSNSIEPNSLEPIYDHRN